MSRSTVIVRVVSQLLPRIITFREDNSNVGTCPDPFLLPRAKGLVPRLVEGLVLRGQTSGNETMGWMETKSALSL